MDMHFSRPEKSLCMTCKFRKPDDVGIRKDGRKFIIEQWNNAECDKYLQKPVDVIFGDNWNCRFYKKGDKEPIVFQSN